MKFNTTKNMKLSSLFALLIIVLSLSSCTVCITEDHFSINKGTTVDEFKKIGIDVNSDHELKNPELTKQGKFTVKVTEMFAAKNDEIYLYAFKDNKLFYWGQAYMFLRSDNPTIRTIGEEMMPFLIKEYSLAKD